MAELDPYRVLIRPVGPLTSEKVYNLSQQMPPGDLEALRATITERRAALRADIEKDETLTKEEKRLKLKKDLRKAQHQSRAARREFNQNQNKIVFMVRIDATKPEIKRAVEAIYKVKVVQVNTLHTKRGKRAIVKLSPKDPAQEIYGRLGQM
jgi:large subunit ribosomal protein L23